jgi:hypothetical protein
MHTCRSADACSCLAVLPATCLCWARTPANCRAPGLHRCVCMTKASCAPHPVLSAAVARRRAPEQAAPDGGPADGGAWEEDDDEAAAARVLRAPPAETDEDFEREFSELMGGGGPQVWPSFCCACLLHVPLPCPAPALTRFVLGTVRCDVGVSALGEAA